MEQPNREGYASHTIYPFNDDQGRLAGALTPMDHSFDTTGQWQAYLDTLLGALVSSDPHEHLDGLYSVTFMSSALGGALVLSRHSHDINTPVTDVIYPTDTIALMQISTDPDWSTRLGLLAVRGGFFPGTGTLRRDKILATVIDTAGTVCGNILTKESKTMARLTGKAMLAALDNQLMDTIPNEWNN